MRQKQRGLKRKNKMEEENQETETENIEEENQETEEEKTEEAEINQDIEDKEENEAEEENKEKKSKTKKPSIEDFEKVTMDKLRGRVIVLDPEKSEIAKELKLTKKADYQKKKS